MEVKVLKMDEREMRIELGGEGHTFCNALQSALLSDDSVELAGYDIQHPLVGRAALSLRTKEGREPLRALLDAAKHVDETLEEIRNAFIEAWEEGENSKSETED